MSRRTRGTTGSTTGCIQHATEMWEPSAWTHVMCSKERSAAGRCVQAKFAGATRAVTVSRLWLSKAEEPTTEPGSGAGGLCSSRTGCSHCDRQCSMQSVGWRMSWLAASVARPVVVALRSNVCKSLGSVCMQVLACLADRQEDIKSSACRKEVGRGNRAQQRWPVCVPCIYACMISPEHGPCTSQSTCLLQLHY